MINNLIKKQTKELKKLEEESRAELFALKFQAAMGNLERQHRIKELKKQISRILTIISSRRIAGENTQINVKINLNETYEKIEKESYAFAQDRKIKVEKMMAEKSTNKNIIMPSLMDLPLDKEMIESENVTKKTPIKVKEIANVKSNDKLVKEKSVSSVSVVKNEEKPKIVAVKSVASTKTEVKFDKVLKKSSTLKNKSTTVKIIKDKLEKLDSNLNAGTEISKEKETEEKIGIIDKVKDF